MLIAWGCEKCFEVLWSGRVQNLETEWSETF